MSGMKRYFWMGLALLLVACHHAPRVERAAHDFVIPTAPATMSREAQIDFLADHYWDHFPFADSLALVRADSAAMLRHFAQFAALLSNKPLRRAPMDTLMRRAEKSRFTLDYFASLADEVLDNPNGPLRSSELYIPILEALLRAPYYDAYERIYPEHALQMALKNRLGEPATNFQFRTRAGVEQSLYELQADYTLILFSNPDCAMCAMLKALILHDAEIVELLTNGRLKMLLLYPDEDMKAWRMAKAAEEVWIDACDEQGTIRREELYDLRAIPSLYLLDRQKRVLVKDSTDPREIAAAMR